MLDRLTGSQVAAVVHSLLSDPSTADGVAIAIPRALVEGAGLPEHVLTDERTVSLRHGVCDKPALLLANTDDDQGASLQEVTLLGVKQFTEEVIRPLFAPCTLFDLALIALLAGLGEEMLFRGILQPALGRWLGPWPGLVLASVLFGLLHPITGTYVVLAALIGAYLGYLFDLRQNLLVVIVAHALYDFVVLACLVRQTPGSETGRIHPASREPQLLDEAPAGD